MSTGNHKERGRSGWLLLVAAALLIPLTMGTIARLANSGNPALDPTSSNRLFDGKPFRVGPVEFRVRMTSPERELYPTGHVPAQPRATDAPGMSLTWRLALPTVVIELSMLTDPLPVTQEI